MNPSPTLTQMNNSGNNAKGQDAKAQREPMGEILSNEMFLGWARSYRKHFRRLAQKARIKPETAAWTSAVGLCDLAKQFADEDIALVMRKPRWETSAKLGMQSEELLTAAASPLCTLNSALPT